MQHFQHQKVSKTGI